MFPEPWHQLGPPCADTHRLTGDPEGRCARCGHWVTAIVRISGHPSIITEGAVRVDQCLIHADAEVRTDYLRYLAENPGAGPLHEDQPMSTATGLYQLIPPDPVSQHREPRAPEEQYAAAMRYAGASFTVPLDTACDENLRAAMGAEYHMSQDPLLDYARERRQLGEYACEHPGEYPATVAAHNAVCARPLAVGMAGCDRCGWADPTRPDDTTDAARYAARYAGQHYVPSTGTWCGGAGGSSSAGDVVAAGGSGGGGCQDSYAAAAARLPGLLHTLPGGFALTVASGPGRWLEAWRHVAQGVWIAPAGEDTEDLAAEPMRAAELRDLLASQGRWTPPPPPPEPPW